MSKHNHIKESLTAELWMIAAFSSALAIFDDLFGGEVAIHRETLSDLERIYDRLGEIVRKQKRLNGVSPSIKAY